MSKIGEITSKIILGPAELVGEFDDAGEAAAAKANLDIFLKWALEAPEGKAAPPAVALIVVQSKLDPVDDRPRKSDWGGATPESRLEGASVVIDAPRSKNARDAVRRVLNNAKVKKIIVRPKAGAGGGRRRAILALAGAGLLVAIGAGAWFFFLRS